MQGHVGQIPPENNRGSLFTTFPWLAAAKVLCVRLASMHTFSPLLSRNFRDFRKKNLCKSAEKSTPWIVVGGSAPLDYTIVFGSILCLPDFKGSHFTWENKRLSRLRPKPPHQFFGIGQIKTYCHRLRRKNFAGSHVGTLAAFAMKNPYMDS